MQTMYLFTSSIPMPRLDHFIRKPALRNRMGTIKKRYVKFTPFGLAGVSEDNALGLRSPRALLRKMLIFP